MTMVLGAIHVFLGLLWFALTRRRHPPPRPGPSQESVIRTLDRITGARLLDLRRPLALSRD